jgi:hypothetical protein
MRARAAVGLAFAATAGAGLGAAGCDWRAFDTLQGETPVLSVGAPSGYPVSSDFGSVLLPLTPPADGSVAARFLGAGSVQTGLAIVNLDVAGQPSGQTVTGSALDDLNDVPVTAMAEVPGMGEALLGAPSVDGGSLLALNLTSLAVSAFQVSSEPQFGVGVAAGNLGGAAAPDFVALSGTAIHVFIDGSSSTDLSASDSPACPIALLEALPSADRINRAVVIGALTGSGTQIAVGTPEVSAGGTVSFFTVDATAGTVTCAQLLSAPLATDTRFGQALAIGDFDNDGISDLLVGAPPNHAYLYRGPIAAGAAPTATIPATTTGGNFGAALATLSLDGTPGDEALIGDSAATVGGQMQAGDVLIFSGATLGKKLDPVLADRDPGGGEAYGSALGALPFCATTPCAVKPPRLPLVGTASQIFTYFTLGPSDPRKK